MKTRIARSLAALLAASTASLALAQAIPYSPSTPPVGMNEARPAPQPPANLIVEPVASASRTGGSDGELAKGIVETLNADASMKNSKITVQPENGTITLTGATMTRDQVKRAGQIATAAAGEGKVINAILDSQT